ncbi:uncharacterized protein LOC113790195 [Dermatophagoides pteronyssinus]|uniref:uncharacterized protein LOC113790195 n=1 Tax=Dermatophagoides pteronyssinus TaxID=6956 RepID=UPI003F663465
MNNQQQIINILNNHHFISIFIHCWLLTIVKIFGQPTNEYSTLSSISMNFDNQTNFDPLIIVTLSSANDSKWTELCPCRLCRYDDLGNREIICDNGGYIDIPFDRISSNVDSIVISAPNDRPNNLTLGPLFYRFPRLKKLRITKSRIPAIGSSTFRYRTILQTLDLSQNLIKHLIDSNFHGLRQLETLNLSHNLLSELASGTFQQLYRLKHLSLANNRLDTITTRLFYNLTNLITLDLSSNPIHEIPPKNIIDLRSLQQLSLRNCQLKQIHSLFYQNLPNLKILDLRNNYLKIINTFEFSSLHQLIDLYLDYNHLNQIDSLAFVGLNLRHLSLSNNYLIELPEQTFSNCTIIELDLSTNNFTTFDSKIFESLSNDLKKLSLNNITTLKEPSISVSRLLSPLRQLEFVELSYLRLDSGSSNSLSSDLFGQNRQTLRHVNLSHNAFVNISVRLLDELYQIEVLDLSYNSLYELSSEFLYILNQYKNLSLIFFDQNPWSCYRCHLLYFRNWITTPYSSIHSKYNNNNNNDRIENLNTINNDSQEFDENSLTSLPTIVLNPYQKACQIYDRCAICRYPPNLDGIRVDLLEDWKLEWCTDPTVQLRVSTTEPNVGLVLALLIIIILIIVIIGVIVYYRNRGAIYFTNEELLYGRQSAYDDGTTTTGPIGGIMHQSNHKSSAYNISNAIRYFADATASPPDSMSVASIDSLYHHSNASHPHHYHHRNSLQQQQQRSTTTTIVDHKPMNGQLYAQVNRSSLRRNELRPQASYESTTKTTIPRIKTGQLNRLQSSDKSVSGSIATLQREHRLSSDNQTQMDNKSHSTALLRQQRSQQSIISNHSMEEPLIESVPISTLKRSSGKKVIMLNSQPTIELSEPPKLSKPPPPPPMNGKKTIKSIQSIPSKQSTTSKSLSLSSNQSSFGNKDKGGGKDSINESKSSKRKKRSTIDTSKSTPLTPPPPPPPTSTSSSSSSSSSSASSSTSSSSSSSLNSSSISKSIDHQDSDDDHHGHDINDSDDDDDNLPQTLCPYEEVEHNSINDDSNDNDDSDSREPSPSGSIDLSPPTELPAAATKHHQNNNQQKQQQQSSSAIEPNEPINCSSSLEEEESLTTAALAENGTGNCSQLSSAGSIGGHSSTEFGPKSD